MIRHRHLQGAFALAALFSIGCGADFDTATGEDSMDGIESTQQEIWKASWSGRGDGDIPMGIARTKNGRPYAWYKSGWACYGKELFPSAENICATKEFQFYVPPGRTPKDIRASAIKKDNSHVVTWYNNGTSDGAYTSGTSSQLDAYSTQTLFHPATKPGGGTFSMDQLIDADHNGADGRYYYYWSTSGCPQGVDPGCQPALVYRTIGTVDRADAYSPATPVTIPVPAVHGGIRGISINNFGVAPIMITSYIAYYADGFMNISTSSLNLAQP